jgi:alpha,alpha-trehalase
MINEYIRINLAKTLREQREDSYPFFALPKPYNVPCASGMFQEMYYWDTYFTNRGLLLDGNVEQARNNVDNLLAMADRFGFVLNGNRAEFLNNSQPPFMSQAVREIYEATGDKEWLANALHAIESEYRFYTVERGSGIGLSHYDAVMPISEEQKQRGAELLIDRLGYTPDVSLGELARGLFAVGESGWDINPRMTYRAYDYAAADLNSLIYSIENNMEYFSLELGSLDAAREWRLRKEERRCSAVSIFAVMTEYSTTTISKTASARDSSARRAIIPCISVWRAVTKLRRRGICCLSSRLSGAPLLLLGAMRYVAPSSGGIRTDGRLCSRS